MTDCKITLRQAIMAIPATRAVVVFVRDTGGCDKAYKSESLRYSMIWRVNLPVDNCDGENRRRSRVLTFTQSNLCDTGVLLDGREASLDITHQNTGDVAIAIYVDSN